MEASGDVTKTPAKPGVAHNDGAVESHQDQHAGDDPSNPHYFGLPLGVLIATAISVTAVSITLLKFFH